MNKKELLNHLGHKIVIARYGDNQDVTIECENCNEVLYSCETHQITVKKRLKVNRIRPFIVEKQISIKKIN